MSQTFPKETPTTNKHIIKMFYIIVGMQVDPHNCNCSWLPIKNIGMATAKMPPHSQGCEDWKKTGTLIYHRWECGVAQLLKKASWENLRKHEVHIWPINSEDLAKKVKDILLCKSMHKNGPSTAIHNSKKVGPSKCPSAGECVSKCGISLQEGTKLPSRVTRTSYRLQHGVTLKTQSTRSFAF